MKKKKLKKRVKKLKSTVFEQANELEVVRKYINEVHNTHREKISNLGEKYIKLREDFNRLEQKTSAALDGVEDVHKKLDILKQRTDIDYTQFSKPIVDTSKGPDTVFVTGEKIEETTTPSCETCKYKGLETMGADSPCFGCIVTEGNFKMYEPKENLNE